MTTPATPPNGRTILVIDDHPDELQGPDKLPQLVAELGDPSIRLVFCRDWPSARPLLLGDSALDVRVVLLDQNFDGDVQLVDRNGNVIRRPTPVHKRDQGFTIAHRIARECGPLRPIVLQFTIPGVDIDRAGAAKEAGILDDYQHKPEDPEYQSRDGRHYARLLDFLRWHLNPIEAVAHALGDIPPEVDRSVDGWLPGKLACWRRDTPAYLERLVAEMRRQEPPALTFDLCNRVSKLPDWPDWKAGWPDAPAARREALWTRIVGRFPGFEDWKPDDDPLRSNPDELPLRTHGHRVHYFARCQPDNSTRLLALIDPRALAADHSRAEVEALERLLPVFDARAYAAGRPFKFRWPLPPLAPASSLPWLVGFGAVLPPGSKWTTLAAWRVGLVRDRKPLRDALARRRAAIAQALQLGRDTDCSGLLLDALLMNCDERATEPHDAWILPELPCRPLGLHPDPQARKFSTWQDSHNLYQSDWLTAAILWIVHGRYPKTPTPKTLARSWHRLGRLLDGRPLPLDLAGAWWADDRNWSQAVDERLRGSGRRKGRITRIVRRGKGTLELPADSRFLGAKGSPPLWIVEPAIQIDGGRLKVDDDAQGSNKPDNPVLPAFDQMTFRHLVTLEDLTVVDRAGQPARLILRDCRFEKGLVLRRIRAAGITIERCAFPAAREVPLRVESLDLEGDLDLIDLDAPASTHLHAVHVTRLSVKMHAVDRPPLHVHAKYLDARTVVLHGPNVDYAPAGCNTDRLSLCIEKGTIQTAIESQGLARLTLEGGTRLDGDLQVTAEKNHTPRLAGLTIDESRVLGSLLLQSTTWHGPLELRNSYIGGVVRGHPAQTSANVDVTRSEFQALTIAGTTCVGDLLFSHANFHGPVCVSHPAVGAKPDAPTDISSAVIQGQLDFSDAHFHQPADFSHVVLAQPARFAYAHFHQPADFSGLQAAGNLVFDDAHFDKRAAFVELIAAGAVTFQKAHFREPPDFSGATLERGLRLNGVTWPVTADRPNAPAARFEHLECRGRLDLSSPRCLIGADPDKAPVPIHDRDPFWVNLRHATVGESVDLDLTAMTRSLDRAEALDRELARNPDRAGPLDRHSDSSPAAPRLARLFETSLRHAMRHDEADRFTWKANVRCQWPSLFKPFARLLGAIGNLRSWRSHLNPLNWLLDAILLGVLHPFLTLLTALLLAVVATLFAIGIVGGHHLSFLPTLAHAVLAESPEFASPPGYPDVPAWLRSLLVCISFIELVLLNIFLVGLARKSLR